jgi:glycosyltransferase involved in cell wall biosynthesis
MRKISVIIPTYNSEKTIERAIESVLLQEGIDELFEVEILICDDHSTDSTLIICKDYPCKIFRSDHNTGGPNWGRNTGIESATGDYIAFLDHDDAWLPDKIIKQLKAIENGAELVYSPCLKKLEYND